MKTLLMLLFIFPIFADTETTETEVDPKVEILFRLNQNMPGTFKIDFLDRDACQMTLTKTTESIFTEWSFSLLDMNFDELSVESKFMCNDYSKCIDINSEEVTDQRIITTSASDWNIPFSNHEESELTLKTRAATLTELYNECTVDEEIEETTSSGLLDYQDPILRFGVAY